MRADAMPHRRPRRAVTLIEAVLFIAVALGLIVGGLVVYQQANTAYLTQRTVALYSAILVEARLLADQMARSMVPDPDSAIPYEGLDLAPYLIAAGAVPENAINDARDTILTPWGSRTGDMLIVRLDADDFPGVETGAETSDRQVLLSMCDVPVGVCTRLLSYSDDGTNRIGSGLLGVSLDSDNCAGGADDSDVLLAFLRNGDVVTPAMAGTACAAAPPPGNRLAIVFTHQ